MRRGVTFSFGLIVALTFASDSYAGWPRIPSASTIIEDATGVDVPATPKPIRDIAPNGISTGRISPVRRPQPNHSHLPVVGPGDIGYRPSSRPPGKRLGQSARRVIVEDEPRRIAPAPQPVFIPPTSQPVAPQLTPEQQIAVGILRAIQDASQRP